MKILFLIKREFIRENINYYPTDVTQAVALNRAKQFEEESKKLHLMFWYMLSTYGDLTQFFKKEEYLPKIISKIKEKETRALTLYGKVIMESENPSIHYSYARFCENILGDLETAEIHRLYAKNLSDQDDVEDTVVPMEGAESPKVETLYKKEKDEKRDTDSDIDKRYGLNIDEQGNRMKSDQKIPKIKENEDIELNDMEIEDPEEDHIGEIDIKIPGKVINLRENDYGTPLENSFIGVPVEGDKKPMIPKLNFKSSFKDDPNEQKINSKPLETFRADILIPNDDELSLISGLSENDVIEEQNIIGSNEKTTYKILRGKINEKIVVKNYNTCIFSSFILAVLILTICFILVFVDLGIFSTQVSPVLSVGAITTLSQSVYLDTRKTYNAYYNGGNLTDSLINLKNSSQDLLNAKQNSYNYIYDYQRTCTFTCNYYSEAYNLWNSPIIKTKNYFGNIPTEELTSLKDFTNSYVESSTKLSKGNLGNLESNSDYQYITQNVQQNISPLLKTIQNNYIYINYGKIGLVLLISLFAILFVFISCIPFIILYKDSQKSRRKALNLYSVIKSQKLSQEIFSSLKAKDMIKPDTIKQKASTFFAEKSYKESFMIKNGTCVSLFYSIFLILFSFLMILAGMWLVYSLYFYMYSFMISDITCSEERNFYSSKIRLITQELENGTTNYQLNDLRNEIGNLNEIHRAILQGNSSRFNCIKSEGRYSSQNILLNNKRCENSTINCMSLNTLLQYYSVVGRSIQVVNDSAFIEFKRVEPEVKSVLKQSQNLFIEEGSYYSDIMLNVLLYLFSVSLPIFLFIFFNIILPFLEKVKFENEVSERMFSLIPLKFLTSNQKIRDYFNEEIFEEKNDEIEYKKEADFYMKILLSSSQPIILFSNDVEGQILIYNMNDIAFKLFECKEDMKDLPLVTIFPNQLQIIKRYLNMLYEDKVLLPEEVQIKGRSSSGKVLNLIATFHEITEDVCVMHLKEESTLSKDLLLEKEKSIQTLKYDNIPQEYMYRIIKGERTIFETFNNITIVCIEFIKLDTYITKLNGDDLQRMLSLYTNLLDTLSQNFELTQLNSYGNTFILSNDLFDVNSKEVMASNALNFGVKCLQLLKEINQKISTPIDVAISVHQGSGLVAIRPCSRASKSRYIVEVYGDVVIACESLVKVAPKNTVSVTNNVYDVANKSFKFDRKEGVYFLQNNISSKDLVEDHKKEDEVFEL